MKRLIYNAPLEYAQYDCGTKPPKKRKKERITMASKNTNQINIPQAREAMDKFKMQAASELDVPVTY